MYTFLSKILNRPVAVFMFYLGLLILGALSLGDLDISLLPPLEYPEVSVHAKYTGAMPEEVEQGVVRPLEEALSVVNGVTEVTSRSMQDEAFLTVKLAWGTDMKYAALNIRQQADRVYSRFPEGAQRPVINIRNPQNRPIATFALSGAPKKELACFAEYIVKKRLEQIGGVAEASVIGAPEREIHIIVDPDALTRQGFSLKTVQKALRDNNILSGGGSIKKGNFRLTLRIQSEYRSVEDIAETPVFKEGGGFFVPLKKIAQVIDSIKEPESLTRINGKPCIAIDIRKESGANTLQVQGRLQSVIDQLRISYKDLKIEMVYSQAGFIKETLSSVTYAILIGAFLAVIVLFIFLSNWRAPLIISISIPVSIIAAFLWMKFTGVGLNVISIAGLALGGGMLVDNSIVALENIHRYREMGKNAFEAATLGVSEVALPITASTLTTIAVFIPVIFLKDISAAIFTDQAKTVSYALIASLIVGFTLLPVIYLQFEKNKNHPSNESRSFFNKNLLPFYEKVLNYTLKHDNLFLIIVAILLCASFALSSYLDRRLLPETEQHAIEVNMNYLPGVTLELIDRKSSLLAKSYLSDHKVKLLFSEMGKKPGVFFESDERKLNRSYFFMRLDESAKSAEVLKNIIKCSPRGELIQYDFRKVEPALRGVLGENSAPLSLYISGPDLTVLDSLSNLLTEKIKQKCPGAIYRSNFFERDPTLMLTIDRPKLARFGLTPHDISATLEHTLKGFKATDFREFDRKIAVIIRGSEDFRMNIDRILNMNVKNHPLRDLVTINQIHELSYIERKDQSRVFRLDMRGSGIIKLSNNVQSIVKEISLPAGYYISLGGEWLESKKSIKLLLFAFIMAVVLVYLILASQFESFKAPFIILFTVPLALIGIVPALLITGMTMNIMSGIGFVVIVGIVVNDGIIKIDFIQRAHKGGMALEKAIHQAGQMRLRPIIMTTVTTVLGLLPLSLGLGPGADLQQPMAIAIIGGEGVATILTIFVLPILYKKLMKNIKVNHA